MLERIRQAKKIHNLERISTGRGKLASSLRGARRSGPNAGVHVHVRLIGWVPADWDSKALDLMSKAGVEVRRL